MWIEGLQQALDRTFNQLLVLDVLDIIRLHQGEDLGEDAQVLIIIPARQYTLGHTRPDEEAADTSTSTTSSTRLPPKNLGIPLPSLVYPLLIDPLLAFHSLVFAASATRTHSPSGLNGYYGR